MAENGIVSCSLGDDELGTNGDSCTVTCNDGFMLRRDAARRLRVSDRQNRWLGDEARYEPGVKEVYNFCIAL